MKTIASFLIILAFALGPGAQSASLNETLQKGLVEEETNRNLSNAISAYQEVLGQYDAQHQAAATAAFRLAECYAKLGRTNDAITLLRRVTSEFAGQTSLAALSRQRLADLGAATLPAINRSMLPATDQRQLELLDQEVQLIQRQIASINNMIQVGRASTDDLIPPQRNMLELQRKMAEIEGRVRGDLLAVLPTNASASAAPPKPPPVDPEAKEIESWTKILAESPDLVNQKQGGALRVAASNGQLKLAEFLLDHGADITLASEQGTALHWAVGRKNLETIRFLVKRGAVLDTGSTFSGIRPLHQSVHEGWLEGTKFLLEAGASPNIRGPFDWTPLHLAAWSGHFELVKLLLAKGADINCQDKNGATPLLIAIGNNFNRIAEFLLSEKADVHLRGWVLDANNGPGTIYQLPNKAVQSGLPSDHILMPPVFAAIMNNTAMIQPLLQRGASLLETNSSGDTVLDWLVSRNDLPAIKTYAQQFPREIRNRALLHNLRTRFADPSKETNIDDAIIWLVDNGADINGRSANGLSPLSYAVQHDKTDLTKYLLTHGADAKTGDDQGNTLIHIAALKQNRELIDLLAQRGADINATNRRGLTPFDLCLMPGLLSLKDQEFSYTYPSLVSVDPATLDLLTRLGAKHSVTFEEKKAVISRTTAPFGGFTPPPRAQSALPGISAPDGSPTGAVTRP